MKKRSSCREKDKTARLRQIATTQEGLTKKKAAQAAPERANAAQEWEGATGTRRARHEAEEPEAQHKAAVGQATRTRMGTVTSKDPKVGDGPGGFLDRQEEGVHAEELLRTEGARIQQLEEAKRKSQRQIEELQRNLQTANQDVAEARATEEAHREKSKDYGLQMFIAMNELLSENAKLTAEKLRLEQPPRPEGVVDAPSGGEKPVYVVYMTHGVDTREFFGEWLSGELHRCGRVHQEGTPGMGARREGLRGQAVLLVGMGMPRIDPQDREAMNSILAEEPASLTSIFLWKNSRSTVTLPGYEIINLTYGDDKKVEGPAGQLQRLRDLFSPRELLPQKEVNPEEKFPHFKEWEAWFASSSGPTRYHD